MNEKCFGCIAFSLIVLLYILDDILPHPLFPSVASINTEY